MQNVHGGCELSRALFDIRIEKGLSLEELSGRSLLPIADIAYLETHRFTDYAKNIQKIYSAFGVEIEAIFAHALDARTAGEPKENGEFLLAQVGFGLLLGTFAELPKVNFSAISTMTGIDREEIRAAFQGKITPKTKSLETLLSFYQVSIQSEVVQAISKVGLLPIYVDMATRKHEAKVARSLHAHKDGPGLQTPFVEPSTARLIAMYRQHAGKSIPQILRLTGISLTELMAFESRSVAQHCPELILLTQATGVDFEVNLRAIILKRLGEQALVSSNNMFQGHRLGTYLRHAREEAGITPLLMGVRSNLPQSAVSEFESGLVSDQTRSFERLLAFYGFSFAQLFRLAGAVVIEIPQPNASRHDEVIKRATLADRERKKRPEVVDVETNLEPTLPPPKAENLTPKTPPPLQAKPAPKLSEKEALRHASFTKVASEVTPDADEQFYVDEMEIADLFKAIRDKIGASILDVSFSAGLPASAIEKFESTPIAMHLGDVIKLAKGLGVDILRNLRDALKRCYEVRGLSNLTPGDPVVKMGRLLAEAMSKAQVNHQTLSELTGISQIAIKSLETGFGPRPLQSFERVVHAYGINPRAIFFPPEVSDHPADGSQKHSAPGSGAFTGRPSNTTLTGEADQGKPPISDFVYEAELGRWVAIVDNSMLSVTPTPHGDLSISYLGCDVRGFSSIEEAKESAEGVVASILKYAALKDPNNAQWKKS